MRRLIVSTCVIASACALASPARSADLPLNGPRQAFTVNEFLSGWYLRGDVGYRFATDPGGALAGSSFTSSSVGDNGSVSLGIGYQAGWLRGDVTANYGFRPKFVGNTAAASPDVSAHMDAITTLFNGYVDFSPWHGFTPYIGAGLGFSVIKPANLVTVSVPAGVTSSAPSRFDFAWDVTAGATYALSRSWMIDTSYRYIHIGNPTSVLNGVGTIDYGDLSAHELRAGLRFLID